MSFQLIAEPWWVNLLVLVPPFAYFRWRRSGVALAPRQLLASGIFAAAFGCVEAVVVVYLRAATDRKSTRLNSSHSQISYAVFCLKKKKSKSSTVSSQQRADHALRC